MISKEIASADILIVDDEQDIRRLITGILEDEGYNTRQAPGAKECFANIQQKKPDLIILDIWLQGSTHDGLEILDQLQLDCPQVPVIMISGHGTIETAVQSIQKGAYDFIEKPFKSDRLLLMIRRALEAAALKRENEHLKKAVPNTVLEFIGSSSTTQQLRQNLTRVATTNSRVLLTGDAGTGKEVAARYIHQNSPRSDHPFVVLNSATLRPENLELELFGSVQEKQKTSIIEKAEGGTLFLDEVSDMPRETQGKILRFLQEQSYQKIGGTKNHDVDVRILASTNKDLEALIKQNKFREDLYYRLNVVKIELLPLKERIGDIPELCQHFAEDIARTSGLNVRKFSDHVFSVFQSYHWPGNIRQLKNIIEWMLIMGNTKSGEFQIDDLPAELLGKGQTEDTNMGSGFIGLNLLNLPLREAREKFEREYLSAQVNRFQGNVSKTAEFIGMERSALHRKLKSLQVKEESDVQSHSLDQKRA